MNKLAPLQHVVALTLFVSVDAYNWLSQHAPYYIDAIQTCLADGVPPDSIRRYLSAQVGTERQAIAIRAEQAARHIQRAS